jgi:kinesin family member 22
MKWLLDQNAIKIAASYFEIYNEKIYDLLDTSDRKLNLDLRETDKKEIIIAGVTVVDICKLEGFTVAHETALSQRSTGATKLNQESSRSHFILQLTIKIKQGEKEFMSKIHLIDLAGSEDNKRTGNFGMRMNESCAINKSLFVLGQVVEGLNKCQSRIPYRDSKITRLLQDSLGGRALGVMIACCSPNEENFLDTYNTLNFATKSSLVKNIVAVNEIVAQKLAEDVSRKASLQEWKSKKVDLGPPSKKIRTSGEGSRTSDPKHILKPRNSYSENLVVGGNREEFEREVNSRVEEKVAAKMKELTNNLVSSKQFQRAVTDRFALVEHRLDKKLELVSKAAIEKENLAQKVDVIDLESLKETTKKEMLDVINNGNLKSMYGALIRMKLKMIGKKRAEAILESRERDGIFVELDDLIRTGLKATQISSIFKVLCIDVGKYCHPD